MRKTYRRPLEKPTKKYRTNEEITAPEVRVIDDNGDYLGVLSIEDALTRARSNEMDLIETDPKAEPPVCKITDKGRFQYQQEKDMRKAKAKQKTMEVKGIRLSLRIGQHDLEIRQKAAKKFLEQNDKVKIELVLRGRERQHIPAAKQIILDFMNVLKDVHGLPVAMDETIGIQGGRVSAVIGLKKG